MYGYAGKILRVDLTNRRVSTIDARDYEDWGGGHGMGSAIFFDLVKDKTIGAFDPRNVVTIMTSPLAGTLAPSASRTEVQGIGPQSSPIEWFTRSNFGGRFAAVLKYAGWDGIVIEGKAFGPVWLDVRNEDVRINDARSLWGLDTWATQQEIWQEVGDGSSAQKPAVLAIGPAGENLCRVACLVHDAGNAAGQGGFGAVWGSKNLKAISIQGTGSVRISNPKALMDGMLWARKNFSIDLNDPREFEGKVGQFAGMLMGFGSPPLTNGFWETPKTSRPKACTSCRAGCRRLSDTGEGNDSICAETMWYSYLDLERHNGKQTRAAYVAADLTQKYGINACELIRGLRYIKNLNEMGILGAGKPIDCDLPFDKIGSLEFAEKLLGMIAYREGIGDDMAEGFYRAAERWSRLEEDLETGLLDYPYWGLPVHYDPRAELEWGYGSILGDRDINEHAFNFLLGIPSFALAQGQSPPISAEEIVKLFSEKLMPYENDPSMLDYSDENMYSDHIVKLVAWQRYYSRFWKQSILYCDLVFPNFVNINHPDKKGYTGDAEQMFFNAVTGKSYSFVDGIQVGKKIWNLDNAIWTLQGRHRDMVHFPDYIYKVPLSPVYPIPAHYMPGKKNGKWEYLQLDGRCLDRSRFEEWKTKYYAWEGWDRDSGWPKRSALEALELGYVADELEKEGRLGAE